MPSAGKLTGQLDDHWGIKRWPLGLVAKSLIFKPLNLLYFLAVLAVFCELVSE
jgi:hypothetical protein